MVLRCKGAPPNARLSSAWQLISSLTQRPNLNERMSGLYSSQTKQAKFHHDRTNTKVFPGLDDRSYSRRGFLPQNLLGLKSSPHLKLDSYIRTITKDVRIMIGFFYPYRKYPTTPGAIFTLTRIKRNQNWSIVATSELVLCRRHCAVLTVYKSLRGLVDD